MHEHSASRPAPASTAVDFDLLGFRRISGLVQRAFLKVWIDAKRQPSDAEAAGMKGRMMSDRARPFDMILRLSFAAIDAGFSLAAVLAWIPVYEREVREYAERRGRRLRSARMLSFSESWNRVNARNAVIEGAANTACWQVKDSDRASLERAKKDLIDEKATIDVQVALLDEQLAKLATV